MTTTLRESDWPGALLTCAQMGRADRWTVDNAYASGIALMDNAGAAVAGLVLERYGDAARILVLCGPGNNGGDGYVAAQVLREAGVATTLHAFGDPKPGTDAAIAAERYEGLVESPGSFYPTADDVVIDALFGAGLTRGLPGDAAAALAKAHEAGSRIVAVDLPSGVNGDSGADLGGAVVADATVTFFRKKPGHLLFPGRALCGDINVADIGVRAGVFRDDPPNVFENGPRFGLMRFRMRMQPGTNMPEAMRRCFRADGTRLARHDCRRWPRSGPGRAR